MPQFAPSIQKTAVAPITVAPAGLNCEAELFLGPNDATPVVSSGLRPFVSSGAAQQVNFPVTMPASPGTYHVYVDVHAGGYLILAYQGTEDIVIASPAFTFSAGSGSHPTCPEATAYWYPILNWTISNPAAASVSHTLKLMVLKHSHTYNTDYGPDVVSGTRYGYVTPGQLTIPAGGSYQWRYDGHIWWAAEGRYVCWPPHMKHYTYYYWLQDEMGNQSPQIVLYRP